MADGRDEDYVYTRKECGIRERPSYSDAIHTPRLRHWLDQPRSVELYARGGWWENVEDFDIIKLGASLGRYDIRDYELAEIERYLKKKPRLTLEELKSAAKGRYSKAKPPKPRRRLLEID